MSRPDAGFSVADVDVHYFDDDKVRRLWRELQDQGLVAQATLIHEATLLASWKAGCRVPVGEAMPVWFVAPPALVEVLQRVHLLDVTERIPVRSWKVWFGPALARKQARQEAGRVGGIASGKKRRTPRERPLKQPSTDAVANVNPSGPSGPDRTSPSGPTGPSSPRAPARGEAPTNGADGAKPVPIRETMAALGIPVPAVADGKAPT